MSQTAGGLTVLTYHSFGPERSVTATEPRRFAETIDTFLDDGWQPVELGEWVARGRPAVPRGFAITIDDGLRSITRIAEIITCRDLRPTVFLVTDRVGADNRWPGQPRSIPDEATLDWSEIAKLSAQGFRFGSHSATHARLDRLEPQRVASELERSRATVEEHINWPCELLAYPFGRTSDWVRSVAARHYVAAFSTRLDTTDSHADRFDLSRIDAYYLRDTRVLARVVAGRADSWLRRRRALRSCRGMGRTLVGAGRWLE